VHGMVTLDTVMRELDRKLGVRGIQSEIKLVQRMLDEERLAPFYDLFGASSEEEEVLLAEARFETLADTGSGRELMGWLDHNADGLYEMLVSNARSRPRDDELESIDGAATETASTMSGSRAPMDAQSRSSSITSQIDGDSGDPELRAAIYELLDLMRDMCENMIERARRCGPLLLSIGKTLLSNFRVANQSALKTVFSDREYNIFVERAEALEREVNNKQQKMTQVSNDLLDLYLHANEINERFGQFLNSVADDIRGEGHTAYVETVQAPIKDVFRVIEKTAFETEENRRWNPRFIRDFVRGALVFSNPGAMSNMLMALEMLASRRDAITILRVKDRFGSPTPMGWADCSLNFVFNDDPNRHICELQLIHNNLMLVRTKMGAHDGYDVFRTVTGLMDVLGIRLPQDPLPPSVARGERESSTVAADENSLRAIESLLAKSLASVESSLSSQIRELESSLLARVTLLERRLASVTGDARLPSHSEDHSPTPPRLSVSPRAVSFRSSTSPRPASPR